jgi:flagellar protein FliO/FliZ
MKTTNRIKSFLILITTLPGVSLAAPEIVSASSIFQMVMVLLLVLSLIFLLNKFATKQFSKLGDGKISVIASIPVGHKERAVLLDVEGERILIGVSTGSVRHLSTIHTNKEFIHSKEESDD